MNANQKEILIAAGVAFALGVVFGYKLKGWRVKYLKKIKDFYDKKAAKIQKKLEDEIGMQTSSDTTTTTTVTASQKTTL